VLGRRSPQKELFRPDHTLRDHVGEGSFYGLLAKRGSEWFRDEDFVELYREDVGRPSVPPSQLCIGLLLQSHDGVSDEEAIERSAYDLRWKVALGLGLEEKLCAKSTLQLFRAKLILHEAHEALFERSVRACREAGLLGKRPKVAVAIDTTPVLGRGAVKDTYNLVSDAIRKVVTEACRLKGWEQVQVVEEQGLGRHFAQSFKGAVELDWSDPQARRALVGQLVSDARIALALAKEALRGFASAADRTQELRAARDLLADLLVQDIEEEPEDGEGPQIRRSTADRIISTTDPEMRRGYKSQSKGFDGYKASVVAETTSGVILATDVRAGNVHDREGAPEMVEQAAQRAEKDLGRVLGDTAYGGTEIRAKFEAVGAEVVAKAPPGARKGMFGRGDFRVDARRGTAVCPAGRQSIRRAEVGGEDSGWRYVFSRSHCSSCPMRERCTTSAARKVLVTAKTERLQELRRHQVTKAFRTKYRERVVVEHRIARLVQLGIRQARYFGKRKVAFQIALAAAVANLGLLILGNPGSSGPILLALLLTGITAALVSIFAPFGFRPSRSFHPSRRPRCPSNPALLGRASSCSHPRGMR
jgi:transposase